jgi:hypothetical protein
MSKLKRNRLDSDPSLNIYSLVGKHVFVQHEEEIVGGASAGESDRAEVGRHREGPPQEVQDIQKD